jgi:surface antigen
MKRLATFAACIAALAMLSGPTSIAQADKPSWAGKGGPGKHKYKNKGRKHRYKAHGRRHGGPPPWAPAHGYRAKHKFKYRHRGHVYIGTSADILAIPDTGIGSCNRQVVGGLLGAATGGFLGSKIGGGSGQVAAVIGGTILGALVGGNIGRSMDRIDQNCVGQVLERAPTGQPVVWNNPDQGGRYQVTATRTFEASGGQYCREYQTKIIIDGREQNGFGTACRQPDGSWKRN